MDQSLINFIVGVIGMGLIITGADYKRTPECMISIFTWDGFVQMVLLVVGVALCGLQYTK